MFQSLFFRGIVFLALCLIVAINSSAQGENQDIQVIEIHEKITLDGVLDEKAWELSGKTDFFWQYFPSDSVSAELQTVIYMCYDKKNLYIAAKCYAKEGESYVIPSLKRDFRAGGSDNITFLIDPFNNRTNAFMFGTNPYGIMREGLISGGGTSLEGFSTAWDNKWKSEAKIYEDHWIAEVEIPLSSIQFKKDATTWRFNAYRFETHLDETSTWINIPRNQWMFNLAFMGKMEWENPPTKTGTGISIIPYTYSSLSRDYETTESDIDYKFTAGGDAKIAISSGLNLDLTVNPDFSQVDVDRQITDLSRFEIFFPEKRQFFLENADLFSSFGRNDLNPFFSRRIGIAYDTISERNTDNTILYGARLNGNLSKKWRMGLLNMQTAKDDGIYLPSFNNTVFSLERQVLARSSLAFLFVNRLRTSEDKAKLYAAFDRVVGSEFKFASSDNQYRGKIFYMYNIREEKSKLPMSHGAEFTWDSRHWEMSWLHDWVGEDYAPKLGFVPRRDFFRINPRLSRTFYPSKGPFNTMDISFSPSFFWKPTIGKIDHDFSLGYGAQFKGTGRFGSELHHEYIYLLNDFDPSGSDGLPLKEGTEYETWSWNIFVSSNRSKQITYSFRSTIGQFFHGKRYGIGGNIAYRFQPYGSIEINYSLNQINLPRPYSSAFLYLIGPRIDLTISKKVFWTTFVQYNSQLDNLNINSRLQWRFAPVSDFFLVYSDNYATGDFGPKNRAVIAKLTYWLNL